ncbi:MAG: pfp [Betaproteobacteria bacterium]|nr:pfp [Betaproteobacteria bacterium]
MESSPAVPTVPDLPGPLRAADVAIRDLGPCLLPSPVATHLGENALHFVGTADKVLIGDNLSSLKGYDGNIAEVPALELAGPRNKIFFDPRTVRCGIVTSGGLCPGLNNVVRGIVMELSQAYGVKHIVGFRYGYQGLISRYGHAPIPLTPESVAFINNDGGTILGSSRGAQDPSEVVDNLQAMGIDILFVIGGDGSTLGAMTLTKEIAKRQERIAVIGIPKTIDNDLHFIDRSFGFESAYSAAVEVLRGAHVEARGAHNGIGLVKVMGRHSGVLACHAALASADVDLVLVPEVPMVLEGKHGIFRYLEKVLDRAGNALIVVAEGAGQELIVDPASAGAKDKSGNVKLKDIGTFTRDAINRHFAAEGREITLKYIDPSYAIRSVPATPADAVFCWHLARNAVHAAMAGNTEMLIGCWHGRFVHVPMPLATRGGKQVDTSGDLWMSVIESTGQPRTFS